MALKNANRASTAEKKFLGAFYAAAAEITRVSDKGWDKNEDILNLWRDLAHIATKFSQHPNKKVATLIISGNGKLLSFGANRVPEGVPTQGDYYVKGERKNYIVCSERIALAQLLGISVEPESKSYLNTQQRIQKLTDEIISSGQDNNILKNSFIMTTAPSCETCANAIAPFRPKGVITVNEVGADFTRAESMASATEIFAKHGVSVVYLPQRVLV